MQEATTMEMVKYYIFIFLTVCLVSLAIFFFEVSNVNSYKQQVNYEIERSGGLTPEVVEQLDEYSKTYYKGIFTISSDRLNQKVNYGETVDYMINGKFDIKILPLPDVNLSFKGTGVSQVR